MRKICVNIGKAYISRYTCSFLLFFCFFFISSFFSLSFLFLLFFWSFMDFVHLPFSKNDVPFPIFFGRSYRYTCIDIWQHHYHIFSRQYNITTCYNIYRYTVWFFLLPSFNGSFILCMILGDILCDNFVKFKFCIRFSIDGKIKYDFHSLNFYIEFLIDIFFLI